MGSPCHLSDSNLRTRGYGKPSRSSKKSSGAMYSDYYEEKDNSALTLAQRSVSMTALQGGGVAPLQPRMAQLETLEAKMASIEVSLSTTAITATPRRKKALSTGGGSGGGSVSGTATPVGAGGSQLQRASRDVARELEALRNALRDKENIIQSLKGQLCGPGGGVGRLSEGGGTSLLSNEVDRRAARDRLNRLRQDMDNKRLAIKNLALALDRLDVSDNIDARIQQAELEFQLGREELNLLGLLEEARGLQACLDEADSARSASDDTSLYSFVNGSGHVTLHAVAVDYDAKSPRFGASARDSAPGLYVEWAAADCGIAKGDRLLEVNGKLVSASSKSAGDLQRLLAVSPAPARLVVLRAHRHDGRLEASRQRERADDAERDNVRLSHRISYLEEQVAELRRVAATARTNTASVHNGTTPHEGLLQVFQKGPQVTALVANLPGMASPKNCLPTVRPKSRTHDARSSRSLDFGGASDCSSSGAPIHHYNHHHHHHRQDNNLHCARSTNSLDVCNVKMSSTKHLLQSRSRHHISEIHKMKNNQIRLESHVPEKNLPSEQLKNCSKIPERSRHHNETESERSVSERKKDLNSTNEIPTDGRRGRSHDVQSVKSSDFNSEPRTNSHHYGNAHSNQQQKHNGIEGHNKSLDYSSESSTSITMQNDNQPKHSNNCITPDVKQQRPTPPKKPLRLSLQRATSLQSVTMTQSLATNTAQTSAPDSQQFRKPTKRNYKGEAPLVPNDRVPSRAESCQSALRWPTQAAALQQSMSLNPSRNSMVSVPSNNEKWY